MSIFLLSPKLIKSSEALKKFDPHYTEVIIKRTDEVITVSRGVPFNDFKSLILNGYTLSKEEKIYGLVSGLFTTQWITYALTGGHIGTFFTKVATVGSKIGGTIPGVIRLSAVAVPKFSAAIGSITASQMGSVILPKAYTAAGFLCTRAGSIAIGLAITKTGYDIWSKGKENWDNYKKDKYLLEAAAKYAAGHFCDNVTAQFRVAHYVATYLSQLLRNKVWK